MLVAVLHIQEVIPISLLGAHSAGVKWWKVFERNYEEI